ncbi:MAG: asparagine synthase (glutamine-hydrolyzing) [Pseudodesulfovibrio sp.]|nr:asparagine synthase (glutamine-hydrolyzing) [Pseudodesulfovibrio sp.]
MCGIAGVLRLDGGPSNPEAVHAMLHVMRHRGPDDRDVRSFGPLTLGHLRLSIIAPSPAGRQPMSCDGQRAWVSYNGELYNYLELREEMRARGVRFATETDTEVFLAACLESGTEAFVRFNGMWAAAIWEPHSRHLLLCRDRLGIKPLYYYQDGKHLVFASEVKGVLAWMRHTGMVPTLSVESARTYLGSGLVDGLDETFFEGIRRFPAGNVLHVRDGRVGEFECWWDVEKRATILRQERIDCTPDSLAEELHFLLADAMRLHSRADVPVGVCLSGGLDSSAVAAHAAPCISGLETFTSAFPEGEEWNETSHAAVVNERFGLQGHTCMVDGSTLFETLPKILWHLDEPSLALGVFPQWHVMELASNNVTVVMDGQGGDELFAGYDPYVAVLLYSKLMSGDILGYRETLRGFHRNYGPHRAMALGREVKDLYLARAWESAPENATELLNARLHQELKRTRLPALLRYEDRLSMAFSIESRVPLLDYRLVEFALSLPESLKMGPGWSKYALRLALDGHLPDSIVWRKDKKGFPTPLVEWMKGSMGPRVRELIQSSELLDSIAPDLVKTTLAEWDGASGNEWRLWRLLSLEVWHASYLSRLDRELISVQVVNNGEDT